MSDTVNVFGFGTAVKRADHQMVIVQDPVTDPFRGGVCSALTSIPFP